MTKLHMGRLNLNAKKSFKAILEFSIFRGVKEGKCWIFGGVEEDIKNDVCEHNSAPNYLTTTKLHMRRLDLNIKRSLSAIMKLSTLRRGDAEFRKIWIFEHNSVSDYFAVKKFHLRGPDVNTKTNYIYWFLNFWIYRGQLLNFEKLEFSNITWL